MKIYLMTPECGIARTIYVFNGRKEAKDYIINTTDNLPQHGSLDKYLECTELREIDRSHALFYKKFKGYRLV